MVSETLQLTGRNLEMRQAELSNLQHFLIEAHQEGYGNPEVKSKTDENGGSAIRYKKGRWRYYDHFFGGVPYAGQEVIYKKEQLVWAMQYRGRLLDSTVSSDTVYSFLRQALLQAPEEHPYRGPEHYYGDDLTYYNEWQGDLNNFAGRETILQNGSRSVYDGYILYEGLYFGGLVGK